MYLGQAEKGWLNSKNRLLLGLHGYFHYKERLNQRKTQYNYIDYIQKKTFSESAASRFIKSKHFLSFIALLTLFFADEGHIP